MGVIADNDAKLNEALNSGKVLEVFSELYHPEITMVEASGDSTSGLETCLEREKQFFGSITEFRGGGVKDAVVDEDKGISYNIQWYDCTFADGRTMNMEEVAVRRWKDGKIIHERFFYNA
ncbi:MAG: ester cyclase [Myxococcales bacterium]|nr:ester cyclase [Myxococcales bacterium]